MKKRSFLLAFVLVLITMLTGCFKKDGTEDLKKAIEKAKKLENFTLNTLYEGEIIDSDLWAYFSINHTESKDIIIKDGNYKVKTKIEHIDFNGRKESVEYVEKDGDMINKYAQENGIWTSQKVNNIDLFGSLENLINKADSIEKETIKEQGEKLYSFDIYTSPENTIDFLNNIKIFGENVTVDYFPKPKINVLCDKDLNLVAIEIMDGNDDADITFISGDRTLQYNRGNYLSIFVKNVNGVKESDVEVPAESKNIASVQNNTTNVPVTNSSNSTTNVPVASNSNSTNNTVVPNN